MHLFCHSKIKNFIQERFLSWSRFVVNLLNYVAFCKHPDVYYSALTIDQNNTLTTHD